MTAFDQEPSLGRRRSASREISNRAETSTIRTSSTGASVKALKDDGDELSLQSVSFRIEEEGLKQLNPFFCRRTQVLRSLNTDVRNLFGWTFDLVCWIAASLDIVLRRHRSCLDLSLPPLPKFGVFSGSALHLLMWAYLVSCGVRGELLSMLVFFFPLLTSTCAAVLAIILSTPHVSDGTDRATCYRRCQSALERRTPRVLDAAHTLILLSLTMTWDMCLITNAIIGVLVCPVLAIITAILLHQRIPQWQALLEDRDRLRRLLWRDHEQGPTLFLQDETIPGKRSFAVSIRNRLLPISWCLLLLLFWLQVEDFGETLFAACVAFVFYFVTWMTRTTLPLVLAPKWKPRIFRCLDLLHSIILLLLTVDSVTGVFMFYDICIGLMLVCGFWLLLGSIIAIVRVAPHWQSAMEERDQLWSLLAEEHRWSTSTPMQVI